MSPSCGGSPSAANSGIAGWNHAHHDCAAAALDENIDPKAGQPGQAEGDIAGALLAQHVDGLLVVADKIGRDAPRVVRREQPQARALHRNELPINFHLRGTSGRENQVTHLFSGAQHGRQQSMCGGHSGVRCRLECDLQRGCAWRCHFVCEDLEPE